MPNEGKPFNLWLRWALDSLFKHYELLPEDNKDPHKRQGPCVPRQAVDPDFDFKPEMTNDLLSDFLHGLHHTKNHYLRSPDEMQKLGFTGIPYRI